MADFHGERCHDCVYQVKLADKETAHHKVQYQTSTYYCAKDPPREFTRVTKCDTCGDVKTTREVRYLKVSEVPAACGQWQESEKARRERLERESRQVTR